MELTPSQRADHPHAAEQAPSDIDEWPRWTEAVRALREANVSIVHAPDYALRRHGHGPVCCCLMTGCRSEVCNLNAEIVRRLGPDA